MRKIIYSLVILGIVFSIHSCQDEMVYQEINSIETDPLKSAEINKEKYDKNIQKIAKALAKSLKHEELRKTLKEKAILQIDGDYNILWKEIKDKKVVTDLGEENLIDLLASNITDPNKSKEQKKNDLTEFGINNKKLQISVPLHCEEWDYSLYEPMVTYLPSDFNEDWEKIEAFDSNGNSFMIDVQNEPEYPVIVIRESERRDDDGNLLSEYVTLKNAGMDDGSDDGGGTNPPSGCDRDNDSRKDYLNKGKFNSVDAYRQVESWPNGKPEMKVIITFIEKFGTNYTAKTLTKILTKDGWVTRYVLWSDLKTKDIDVEILTWDKSVYGESMLYSWIEMDSGNPVELNTSVSSKYDNATVTQSVKVTITDEDDEAGDGLVQYCDDTSGEGTEYNTGILKFWVNQQ